MTTKKVKIVYITNDATRRTSFKKRKGGLIQKMEDQLCILCDVKAFMISFSLEEQEPTVGPSPAVADELVERFMSVPELERSKKKVDHDNYLKETRAKKDELVAKQATTNMELEAYHLVDQIQKEGKRIADLTEEETKEIIWFVLEKRKVVAKRRQVARYSAAASSSSTALAPASASPPDSWILCSINVVINLP